MKSAANINIFFDAPGLGWRFISEGSAKLLFAGTVLGIDGYSVLRLLQSAHHNLDVIISVVQQFKGHFGIVYLKGALLTYQVTCIIPTLSILNI